MAVLKNVSGKWRLFWVLEAVGLSFLLAVFSINVTGNGTAVVDRKYFGGSIDGASTFASLVLQDSLQAAACIRVVIHVFCPSCCRDSLMRCAGDKYRFVPSRYIATSRRLQRLDPVFLPHVYLCGWQMFFL